MQENVEKCLQKCQVNVSFIDISNFINRFIKVTPRDTQILKLRVKVTNGISTCSTLIKLLCLF